MELLQPLDEALIHMIRDDVEYNGTRYASAIKGAQRNFRNDHISDGTGHLLGSFDRWWLTMLRQHVEEGQDASSRDWLRWEVTFQTRAWRHLIINPDPSRFGSILVFEKQKFKRRFHIGSDCRERQALIRWLWDYGNKRLIAIDHNMILRPRRNPLQELRNRVRHSTGFNAHDRKRKKKQRPSPLSMGCTKLDDVQEEASSQMANIEEEEREYDTTRDEPTMACGRDQENVQPEVQPNSEQEP
ncbi:uncharacterized protein KY384_008025 [Bacidia gigantensis]|uniref:uncharacterized protein n=1 Tax=Bacidia gigantensis TaxID=2732470 RepID=UPI001D04B5C3|nr:uncharacterized protein KY384_008025 [Bacidia gigantensis]KAG8527281.1 hypothetical protein KY384_008025 [Bacidia gigantensis]